MTIQIILFGLISIGGIGFFAYNIWKIRDNIGIGRDINRNDKKGERIKTMLLVAFGQKKMFSRPIAAFLHLCLYVAFVITQIELIEILADGLSGKHRIFFQLLRIILCVYDKLYRDFIGSCFFRNNYFSCTKELIKTTSAKYERNDWLAYQRCQPHLNL